MAENNRIYLIGSYGKGYRDKIITALPERSFADPRDQRQSSVAKLVCDNLQMAKECPIALAYNPGIMSFVEMGAVVTHGNYLIVVDPDRRHSINGGHPLIPHKNLILEQIAGSLFRELDGAIEFLQSNPNLPKKDTEIVSKYPAGSRENIPMNKVLVCGTGTQELTEAIRRAKKARPDREFYFGTDILKEFSRMSDYDLLVVNFPGDKEWDKHACLLMGAASAHDISILLIDEHDWKYPPLQAVARRHCTVDVLHEYLTEVDDLNISSEARAMYRFFQREQERRRK
jgi:hypothetical protein